MILFLTNFIYILVIFRFYSIIPIKMIKLYLKQVLAFCQTFGLMQINDRSTLIGEFLSTTALAILQANFFLSNSFANYIILTQWDPLLLVYYIPIRNYLSQFKSNQLFTTKNYLQVTSIYNMNL